MLGITLKLAFEPIECRKLSDVDRNIVPNFKSQVVKAFLYLFNVGFWDLQVPAISCSVALVLGPMMIFIPKAFRTLPVEYFLRHNRSVKLY